MYDLAIVIVNYNVRNFLLQCLNSIRNSKCYHLKVEIWVVDNASVDGSVSMLQRDFPDVNLIANSENIGFSRANNQVLKKINSRYVLLLNPDTILEEDTLWKCYSFMEEKLEGGALGVRMIDGAGKFLPESKRKIPDAWNSFCKLSYLSDLFPTSKWFSGYNLGYLPEFQTAEIEVLCGAFMFIRKSVLDEVGLLDEKFFMYGEDIDLSFRILKAGHKIFYFPQTSIIHYKGESTKKSSLNYIKTFYGAMIIYVNKHYSKGNARFFAFFIRLAIQVRAILSALGNLITTLFRPLLDFFIILFLLKLIKTWWASYYFGVSDYYDDTVININFISYSFLWVAGLWFFGRYDKKSSIKHLLIGVISGTLAILVIYALENDVYRTSRALILLGAFTVLLYSMISGYLTDYLNRKVFKISSAKDKNVIIVAYRNSAEKIISIMQKADVKLNSFIVVSPDAAEKDHYYSNNISRLSHLLKVLTVDEVIFSNESMTIKEIIKAMSGLDSTVTFKIGGDDSLSIIGSKSRNYAGEFYSVDIRYNLNESKNRRFKRFVDVIFGIFMILFLPFVYLFNGNRMQILPMIAKVLVGKMTWVGYGGDSSDYSFLPVLNACIIPYPDSFQYLHYTEDYFRKYNMEYAKNYSIWMDIEIILNNLFSFTLYSAANKDL